MVSLREKQAPIKDRYKSDPSSALLTLKSTGTLSSTSIACSLSSGPAVSAAKQKIAGLHPAAGGDDPEISGELCSGDMLLEALVACAGVTLKAVATAMDIELRSGEVRAEGDLDFRGTMGVDVGRDSSQRRSRLISGIEDGASRICRDQDSVCAGYRCRADEGG